MKTIIRERETGKARQLIEFAVENEAVIAAENPDAFRVKAASYGYPDIKVISWDDLNKDWPFLPNKLVIHNMDKMVNLYCNGNLIGFSATLEE